MPSPLDLLKLRSLRKYVDPAAEKLKDWAWKPLVDVRKEIPITGIPDYVQAGYGNFMNEQAKKAAANELSNRDLLKAYLITQSSIGRGGLSYATATKTGLKVPKADEIRPEGAFATWLGSPAGQRYLTAAERGEVDQKALEDIRQKFAPFGKQNQLVDTMTDAVTTIPAMLPELNAAIAGGAKEYRDFAEQLRGIAASKSGFIGSLLGRGDLPTFDARQIGLHTSGMPMPTASPGSILSRGKGQGGREAVDRLAARQEAMQLSIDPSLDPHYQHLSHHAIWDAVGGEKTTHQDLIDAMKNYSEGGPVHMQFGGIPKLASKIGKTTFEMAQELAQKRAALPVSQRGLGLPAGNTPEQRAKALGINMDVFHGSKHDITGAFKPGYEDNLAFVTPDPNFAANWIGKGKLQKRSGKEAEKELEDAEKEFRKIKYEMMDYDSLTKLEGAPFHAEYDKRNDAFQKSFQEKIGLYPDKIHNTVYPLKVAANKTFNPETDINVMSDFFKENNTSPQIQDYFKSGNYLVYETKPVINFLKSKGYDSMRLRESAGDNFPTIAVFNPETVRSRFAAFDPFRKDVATAAAMGVAAPDLLAAEPDKKAVGGLAGSLIRKAGEVASKTKPFYSALDEAISSLPNKALGDQFIKEMLKRGAKPQEIIDRNLDNILGAPIVQKTRTVNLKKPDKKGRTQIEEKYFEVTPSEKGAKSISRADVEKAASDNPPPQIVERTISDKSIDQEVERRLSDRMESMIEDKMDEMDWQSWGVKNARSMARADAEDEVLRETANLRKEIHAEIMDEGGFDPQHKKWSTPGGTNYREIVIKLPNKDLSTNVISKELFGKEMKFLSEGEKDTVHAEMRKQFAARPEFQSSHYGDMNVLAHARVQDRTGPNGEKILQIEEIQSDWHQKARELRKKEIKRLVGDGMTQEDANRAVPSDFGYTSSDVPDAPFKSNWHELVMKRLLDDAARNGYDRVVITPGAEQAKRYDLSKQVEAVRANLNPDGTYQIGIQPIGKNMQRYETSVIPEELDSIVGKELAEKIRTGVKEPGIDSGQVFSGLDLKIGGEGMIGFYDQMLPSFLNKYGEKHGSRVGSMNITVPPKDSMAVQGYPLGEDYMFGRATWDEFLAANPRAAEEFSMPVHSFDINPAMRGEITQKGVPLYQAAPPAAIGAAASEGDENGGGNTTTFFKGGAVHMQSGGLDRPVTMNPNIAAQGKEIKFLREISATPWYLEFLKQYGKAPDLSKNSDYDYRKAWEAGIRPERSPYDENRFHWPSSTNAGEMLKSATHPTAWKEHYMRATGVDPDSVGIKKEDWIKSNSIEQSFSKLNDGMKRGGAVNQDAMNMAVMNKQLRKRHG